MRELTYRERVEYDRMVLGARQLELGDFIEAKKPQKEEKSEQKAEDLLKMSYVQMSLFV